MARILCYHYYFVLITLRTFSHYYNASNLPQVVFSHFIMVNLIKSTYVKRALTYWTASWNTASTKGWWFRPFIEKMSVFFQDCSIFCHLSLPSFWLLLVVQKMTNRGDFTVALRWELWWMGCNGLGKKHLFCNNLPVLNKCLFSIT